MSDVPGTTTPTAIPPTATSAPSAAPPTASSPPPTGAADPYAGLSDEERAAAQQWEATTKDLSPSEKQALLDYARMGYQYTLSQRDKPEKPATATTATPAADPRDAKIAEIEKQLKEFQERMVLEERRKAAAEEERAFYANVNSVFDAEGPLKEHPKARELLTQAVIGSLLEHRGRHGDKLKFDSRAAAKAHIETLREVVKTLAAAEKRGWLEGKVKAAAEALGEAGAGAPPARAAGLTDEQIESGYIGDMLTGA